MEDRMTILRNPALIKKRGAGEQDQEVLVNP